MSNFYSSRKKGDSRCHIAEILAATTAFSCLGDHLRWVCIAPGHGRTLPPRQGVPPLSLNDLLSRKTRLVNRLGIRHRPGQRETDVKNRYSAVRYNR